MTTRAVGSDTTLRQGAEILCNYAEGLWEKKDSDALTVELASPSELEAAFREKGCDLALDAGAPAISDAAVLDACRLALRYSVKANHPQFFNQLYGRIEPTGLLGQWVTSTVGGNCHTYEVAPVFTLTERSVVAKFAQVVGYPKEAEGIFVPGGSMSNLYGMHMARYVQFPQAKTEGMWGCPPLVAFCSDHAHYSYLKNSHVMGLGSNNLIKVATNRFGQMRPEALREAVAEAIAAGKKPFFVGATLGSTVLGAFDDLVALRKVCDESGMWLHADGCWGLTAKQSADPDVRALCDGIDLTDSFAWNPHKAMGLPIQCSVFMTRHTGKLMECNKTSAAYLFQPDKLYADLDIADKTFQCGRLPDSFKLWLAWKHNGDIGWTQRVDKAIALSKHFVEKMDTNGLHGRFQMVIPRCFVNMCFWYIPPSLGDLDPLTLSPDSAEFKRLHAVAPAIKEKMQQDGKALIGFQSIPLEGSTSLPNFWRIVLPSTWSVSESDVEEALLTIDRIGKELFP